MNAIAPYRSAPPVRHLGLFVVLRAHEDGRHEYLLCARGLTAVREYIESLGMSLDKPFSQVKDEFGRWIFTAEPNGRGFPRQYIAQELIEPSEDA